MEEFCNLYGAVYILENSKAQRVKVGMTINSVSDRLRDVNERWLERKGSCQICGGRRLLNTNGLVPHHVVSGVSCLGGNALPIENDVMLAKSYLENMKNRLGGLLSSEKGAVTRKVNNLEKRIERYWDYAGPVGEWRLGIVFYTKSAEKIELLSHKILKNYLDKSAPFGEVFCCSVSIATEAVEVVLNQLGLLYSARRETKLDKDSGR